MGTSDRDASSPRRDGPGPGAYGNETAFGKQPVRPSSGECCATPPLPALHKPHRCCFRLCLQHLGHLEALRASQWPLKTVHLPPARTTSQLTWAPKPLTLAILRRRLGPWGRQSVVKTDPMEPLARVRPLSCISCIAWPHLLAAAGTYGAVGAVGKQPLSTRPTSAAPSFGSSQRAALRPSEAPAPGTYSPNDRAARKSAPAYGMGTGTRDGLAPKNETPAPGAYAPMHGAFGKQPSRPQSASWGFPKSPRKGMAKEGHGPGPNQYNLPSTFGGPKWSVGTSDRGKVARGHDGPGPGSYGAAQGIGPQALSTRPTSARAKFGTSKRPDLRTSDAPPPNTYNPSTYTRILSSSLLSFPSHFI